MCEHVDFVDILEPRRKDALGLGLCFMSRNWYPLKTHILDKQYSPEDLKDIVAKSSYLDAVIEAECSRTGISRTELHQEVYNYLEEMGLDKKLYVIRWMGILFLKITSMMKIKLFVNEAAILNVKSSMGQNPVLILPTHRSYADFCLMTYISYHYDIEFPGVAAGMDFYSMAVIGRSLRDTGAFYIRRTLVGDPLYAATLRQYVRTTVAKLGAPIEFFLEGTRSRSNKSMSPKYGMLSMTLMPLFAHEVTDITIVPINISYDRLMEQTLFAYEHLGVPKPKESTGGFLKALSFLNDHFGSIYINHGTPVSVKEYFKDNISYSDETLKPIDLQQQTPEQFKQVQSLADYIVSMQQKNTVATISNLISLVLMQSIIKNEPLDFENVLEEVNWMITVLRSLGASVFEKDVRSSVENILVVHSKLIRLDKQKRLRLISGVLMDLSNDVKTKMKGHILQAQTMVAAVPIIELQLYVNAMLHYLVPPAIIFLIVHKQPVSKDKLQADYHTIRQLLIHEFFHIEHEEDSIFSKALQYCIENNLVTYSGLVYSIGEDIRLQYLLKWSVWPALHTMQTCAQVLLEQLSCEHKQALKLVQERLEMSRCHPYCLSLEAIANCLQGLAGTGALNKLKGGQDVTYEVAPSELNKSLSLINSVIPHFDVDFGSNNNVIIDHRALSRL